jgi:hypothetical protein
MDSVRILAADHGDVAELVPELPPVLPVPAGMRQ